MTEPEAIAAARTRIDAVTSAIRHQERLAGRKSGSTTLIAVSKTHEADAIRPLLLAGLRDFGENRVQEAQGKWPALKQEFPDITLHLIGQLQSNKAKDAVELFDVIHSVDRPSLVTALGKAMAETGRQLPFFVQVNIGNEEQKGGCAVAELPALLDQCQQAGLNIVGLMAVPPADIEAAPFFALLVELAKRHNLTQLSMGMSGDYETAVLLGSTQVRIGTALFGERG
ncbi:YggS family pyridoxal phosphate-dependent enzyme [Aquisediminimonas sediminicola]|uniref:YggS family pyridoxal phosphate-dependent enzyme n=1 Tax=Alteraquisediminimonas sediminicola TaxID=2676787 RepID=UPI001C8DD856|nr:YggS family pyridoxal phosphate-dependent enzyme [Aquisediminimonas sediminicola]